MRIVIAPDSFKGSLSAFDAAEAMLCGVRRACPEAHVDVCPLSDGGEGFADVLLEASGGASRTSEVTGPAGERVQARWAMLADGQTAVIESAEAIGPGRLQSPDKPERRTTYGIGELLLEAASGAARRVVVGLGGSSTTDGGAGMAQAIGIEFTGAERPITGEGVARARRVDLGTRDARIAGLEILAMTDVDNRLTGMHGAARVYGPQKGANEAEVERLEAALTHLAAMTGDPGAQPGDGAAGGLGYGLRVFAGARVGSGVEFVLDAVGFDARLDACDLVLTGEGRLDATSARGKVVSGVCRRCGPRRVPVVALVGAIGPGSSALKGAGLTACFSLCDGPRTESEAREHAGVLLAELAENVVRLRHGP